MRVLIVADELFASRERSLLTRLEVGLADDGVLVAYAVPQQVIDDTPGGAADISGVFTKVVPYTPPSMPLARRFAAAELERGLCALPGDFDSIDVVHVFGGSAWNLAAQVADELEAPLAVELWRAGLAGPARDLVSAGDRIERTLFIAADPKLEREYQDMPGTNSRHVPPPALRVRSIPWGVLSPQERRSHPQAPGVAQPAAVMLVGSGFDVAAWTATLKGCHEAIRSGLDLLLFADVLAAKRSNLWAVARSLGLLDRLSLIDNLESRRDLVLHGDLLLLPEARGEQRSIILQAMAAEMLVIAAADDNSSILQSDRTCVTLDPTNVGQWTAELRRLLTDRAAALTLAESAKFFIQMHRRASDHVRGVLKAYSDLTASDTLPFPR
jgi:hypothetical protein